MLTFGGVGHGFGFSFGIVGFGFARKGVLCCDAGVGVGGEKEGGLVEVGVQVREVRHFCRWMCEAGWFMTGRAWAAFVGVRCRPV